MGAEWERWAMDKDPHGICLSTSDRRNESIKSNYSLADIPSPIAYTFSSHGDKHSSSFWRCIHLPQLCFSGSFFWAWSWRSLFVNEYWMHRIFCLLPSPSSFFFYIYKRKHPILVCTYINNFIERFLFFSTGKKSTSNAKFCKLSNSLVVGAPIVDATTIKIPLAGGGGGCLHD